MVMSKDGKTLTCPCCGYITTREEYEICEICFWEQDFYQTTNILGTGANAVNLFDAQRNFERTGSCDPAKGKFGRAVNNDDARDHRWRKITEEDVQRGVANGWAFFDDDPLPDRACEIPDADVPWWFSSAR